MNKETQIHIRCMLKEKETITSNAAKLHLSITEFILLRCQDLPLRDKENERKLYEAMMALTGEMNYIGNNINQAVTAIHKLKFTSSDGEACVTAFNRLFADYQSKRDRLATLLQNSIN